MRVHAAAVCILSLRIRMNDLFMDAYMYAYVYTYVRVWREVGAYLCMRHSATDGRTDVDPPVLLGIYTFAAGVLGPLGAGNVLGGSIFLRFWKGFCFVTGY